MKTVVIGPPPPPELQQLIQRRRSLGLDRFDEVWEGNHHLAPVPGFAHGVEEVIVVEPASRTVRIRKVGDGYEDIAVSGVLGLSADGLQSAIRWPARDGLAV